jgi:hypothetical protein
VGEEEEYEGGYDDAPVIRPGAVTPPPYGLAVGTHPSSKKALNPQTIDLVLEGEPGQIALTSLVRVLESTLGILKDLEASLRHETKSALEWYVTELRMGSLAATLEARPTTAQAVPVPLIEEVASAFVTGLGELEERVTLPPGFLDTTMRHVTKIGNTIGRNGAVGLRARTAKAERRVTHEVAVHARAATRPKFQAFGSVLGTLDVIDVHNVQKRVHVRIYTELGRRPVSAYLPPSRLDLAKEALGRRVIASGTVKRNQANELIRIDAEDLELVPLEEDLPSVAELVGSDPRFTGGRSTEEYLRELRA